MLGGQHEYNTPPDRYGIYQRMDPLDQLPFPLQAMIAAATFGLIFVIGRYVMLLIRLGYGVWAFAYGNKRVVDTDDSRRGMAIPGELADIARALYDLEYLPFGAMRRS